MSRTFLLLAASISLVAANAHAETVTYLGRSLNLVPPPGYCAVGDSPSEKIMKEAQRRNTEPAGELAQVAVPCAELADVVAGKRDDFTS